MSSLPADLSFQLALCQFCCSAARNLTRSRRARKDAVPVGEHTDVSSTLKTGATRSASLPCKLINRSFGSSSQGVAMGLLHASSFEKEQPCCRFELASCALRWEYCSAIWRLASLYRSPSWAFPP